MMELPKRHATSLFYGSGQSRGTAGVLEGCLGVSSGYLKCTRGVLRGTLGGHEGYSTGYLRRARLSATRSFLLSSDK
jgi:hypothetical protein